METIFTFEPAYEFEGEEHTNLDMSGLAKLKAIDLADAQNETSSKMLRVPLEDCVEFWNRVLAKSTGKGLEFFEAMPDRIWDKLTKAASEILNETAGEFEIPQPDMFTSRTIANAQTLLDYSDLIFLNKTNHLRYALAVYASATGKKFDDLLNGKAGQAMQIFLAVRNHFFGWDLLMQEIPEST
jgi:hypothetical protein